MNEIAIDGFDYIELYVGNALQAAYYYQHGFGFDIIGFRGMETGDRTESSYALKNDHLLLVVTGALDIKSPVAEHVRNHGDGVKTIGLRVRDAKLAYETALSRGAKSIASVSMQEDKYGKFVSASVQTYGDTVHTFVERHAYKDNFAPGYRPLDRKAGNKVALAAIDHVVGNAPLMDPWVKFYEEVFGFTVFRSFDEQDISTKFSALRSKVMANKSCNIKLPINEPAEGLKKSQIQEYLDYYKTPGVHHIAIATRDIISAVNSLRENGIEFQRVPGSYYDTLADRVGHIDEDVEVLRRLGILVDRESNGYLLQIFTKPVQDRPTFFFEIIQRKGAVGFGKGNFKALFESIEHDQALRGNL
jgi:4-hydroxyphenylpyruvate dioxygenase